MISMRWSCQSIQFPPYRRSECKGSRFAMAGPRGFRSHQLPSWSIKQRVCVSGQRRNPGITTKSHLLAESNGPFASNRMFDPRSKLSATVLLVTLGAYPPSASSPPPSGVPFATAASPSAELPPPSLRTKLYQTHQLQFPTRPLWATTYWIYPIWTIP